MPFDLDKFAKIVLPPEPEGSDAALIKSMDELTAAIKERQQTPPAEPPLPKEEPEGDPPPTDPKED